MINIFNNNQGPSFQYNVLDASTVKLLDDGGWERGHRPIRMGIGTQRVQGVALE